MQNTSELFIQSVKTMPIWVKQYLTKEVLDDLSAKIVDFKELLQSENLIQYMTPKITVKGKMEYNNKTCGFDSNHYTFLAELIESPKNVFEITLKNNWPLAETARILLKLVELEFIDVENFQDCCNYAVALFLSGRIKTGEFLKKIGRIDSNQLEKALRYQKELNAEGRHIKMASILIKFGFISDKGLDSLFLLKNDSKKRFTFTGFGAAQEESTDMSQVRSLQREIARLQHENIIMKTRLKKMLKING